MSDLAEMLASAKAQGYEEGIADLRNKLLEVISNCYSLDSLNYALYSVVDHALVDAIKQLKEKNNG